jgi:hypothetical protein
MELLNVKACNMTTRTPLIHFFKIQAHFGMFIYLSTDIVVISMIYLFLSSFINWFYTSASGLLVPEAIIRLVLSVSDLYGVLYIYILLEFTIP